MFASPQGGQGRCDQQGGEVGLRNWGAENFGLHGVAEGEEGEIVGVDHAVVIEIAVIPAGETILRAIQQNGEIGVIHLAIEIGVAVPGKFDDGGGAGDLLVFEDGEIPDGVVSIAERGAGGPGGGGGNAGTIPATCVIG